MMDFIREGDVLYITKLDRLARSVIDLHNIAKFLQDKDVDLKVLHQNIDTTSPAGRLLFTMLGAIAEFERDLINERVREGIEAAKKKGVQFGRKAILSRPPLHKGTKCDMRFKSSLNSARLNLLNPYK